MSLEYALVTSSSLPEKVQESSNYVTVDKAQWVDLVDYSQDLVEQDSSQRILFLIVAKGTSDQQAADSAAAASTLESQEETDRLAQQAAAEAAASKKRRSELRTKSKSIFNALYGR